MLYTDIIKINYILTKIDKRKQFILSCLQHQWKLKFFSPPTFSFGQEIANDYILNELYKRNIQSLIVEGGENILNSFIDANLWDSARVFISEKKLQKGVNAPALHMEPVVKENISGDKLLFYVNA